MIDTLTAEHEKAGAEQPDGKRTPPFVVRRLEADIESTKAAIASADVQVAAAEKSRDNPVATPSLGPNPYKSVAEYDHMTQGMLEWKDRYYAAIAEKESAEMKRADDFIAAAKDRKLQLKITFQVNKKSPVELRSAKWVSDDKMETAVNSSYVAAVLLDPKRMQQVVDDAVKSRLKLPSSNFEAMESFPIVCGYTVPEGCALRPERESIQMRWQPCVAVYRQQPSNLVGSYRPTRWGRLGTITVPHSFFFGRSDFLDCAPES